MLHILFVNRRWCLWRSDTGFDTPNFRTGPCSNRLPNMGGNQRTSLANPDSLSNLGGYQCSGLVGADRLSNLGSNQCTGMASSNLSTYK